MLIKNANWLNPDGTFSKGSIQVENGRIAELSEGDLSAAGGNVLDADGMLVLPGAIDPHVHFREPGQLYKEGISRASKAALKGGVTTVIDMPNNNPPCTTAGRVAHKKDLFRRKSQVNWGLMLHTTPHSDPAVKCEVKSAKVYMAKSSALPAITETQVIARLMADFPVVSFHAEDESEFDTSPGASPLHHEKRPRQAIVTALQKIESALRSVPADKRPRVIICHMNTADEVRWLKRMKAEGFDVWGETCPHYLFFTQDDYIREGARFQVNPPIRTGKDQQALRLAIADGTIDFMGTDHAPHSNAEKSGDRPPSGIAAIEWLVPQMLHFVDNGLLSWQRFAELMTLNGARCYDVRQRDGIRVGNFADLVLVQRQKDGPAIEKVQTRSGINLYQHIHFNWRVQSTLVNGVIKYRQGRYFTEQKGKEV